MTYTPEQLQAMRDWLAEHACGLVRFHYTSVVEMYKQGTDGKPLMFVNDFKPDEDANQMLMALDTFHDVSIDKTIDMWAVTIWNHPEIGDEWKSEYHKSLGRAALIEMCRASGMPE